MKTLLVWGLRSETSFAVARTLAAAGHRLLVVGDCSANLESLDTSLVQSELHRYAEVAPEGLADWVTEQDLGLDGVVLFPPPPEPSESLLVPLATNVRGVQLGVLEPIEVVRRLRPLLGQEPLPKSVLVILDWLSPLRSPLTDEWLAGVWSGLLPVLSAELCEQQLHVNLIRLGAVLDDSTRQMIMAEAADTATARLRLADLAMRAPGGVLLTPTDVAALACAWASCPLSALSGQQIDYPRR